MLFAFPSRPFCSLCFKFPGNRFPPKPIVFLLRSCKSPHFVCNSLHFLQLQNTLKLLHSGLMPDPRHVLVYTRKGCHLCEIVKESLVKLERRGLFRWQEVDVDADDQLRRQFTDEVPVVFIDGRKAFKYRMDEREFLRKLAI